MYELELTFIAHGQYSECVLTIKSIDLETIRSYAMALPQTLLADHDIYCKLTKEKSLSSPFFLFVYDEAPNEFKAYLEQELNKAIAVEQVARPA